MVNLNQNIELSAAELNDECPISSETFQELAKRKDLTAIACGHKFPRVAITEWFVKEATCPVCRIGVDKQKLFDVALPTHKVATDNLQNSNGHSSKDMKNAKVKDINGALSEEEALAAVLAISALKTNQSSSNSAQSTSSTTNTALLSSNNGSVTVKDMNSDKDLAAAIQLSLKDSSQSSNSSSPLGKNEQTRSIQNVSTYVSFREIERPNLSHECTGMLNFRIKTAKEGSAREQNSIKRCIKTGGVSPLEKSLHKFAKIALILRITKEDGVWSLDLLKEKLDRLIQELELLISEPTSIFPAPNIAELKHFSSKISTFMNNHKNSPMKPIITIDRREHQGIVAEYKTETISYQLNGPKKIIGGTKVILRGNDIQNFENLLQQIKNDPVMYHRLARN